MEKNSLHEIKSVRSNEGESVHSEGESVHSTEKNVPPVRENVPSKRINKPRIREVIVVEGRYDKNTLSQIVHADIVTLEGFSIFHDKGKLDYLRRLAEKRGLIILTDSDGAGFVLRRYLKGSLPREKIRHAYIPDISGKERRKRTPGKEHKLGVEGMRPEILKEALRHCGATFEDDSGTEFENTSGQNAPYIQNAVTKDIQEAVTKDIRDTVTKADLMEWGLSGGTGSAERRKKLLQKLSLPEKLNANGLLEAMNLLYNREEIHALVQTLDDCTDFG